MGQTQQFTNLLKAELSPEEALIVTKLVNLDVSSAIGLVCLTQLDLETVKKLLIDLEGKGYVNFLPALSMVKIVKASPLAEKKANASPEEEDNQRFWDYSSAHASGFPYGAAVAAFRQLGAGLGDRPPHPFEELKSVTE